MSTTTTPRIAEWNVVDHGVEHAQYFQGHGTASTDWTHTATGCGSDTREALDDALEQLAQQPELDGIDWEGLHKTICDKYTDLKSPGKVAAASVSAYHERFNPNAENPVLCSDDCDECEHHYYLSIDLRVE